MRRVITISLNGNAYQLEEDASEALARYLDAAAQALAGNPDREEIHSDLEQAIADKCGRFLGPHKSVLRLAELQQVIEEMGPVHVEGGAGAAQAQPGAGATASGSGGAAGTGAAPGTEGAPGATAGDAGHSPRRLYQISEGAYISGLCNGLAAWLGVDVTPVRVVAVILAFLTGGVAAIIYIVLMFIVPVARTSEERAAAHGLPFNAHMLVERAKQKYSQFASSAREQADHSGWRREWRREWRHARAELRMARREARQGWQAPGSAPPPRANVPPAAPVPLATAPLHYTAQVLTRLLLAVLGVFLAVFMVGWLLSLLSYLTTGAIFGWSLPFHAPFWVVLVGMFVLYGMVTGPIRAARHAARSPMAPYPGALLGTLDGLLATAVVIALAWYAAHHVPEIRSFFEQLRGTLQAAAVYT
jgi:phage shock protein PspC (stress-responsive transcriptional regulator)